MFHCLSLSLFTSLSCSSAIWVRLEFFFQFATALVKCLWQQINQDINNPHSGLLKGNGGNEGNGQWAAAKKGFSGAKVSKIEL